MRSRHTSLDFALVAFAVAGGVFLIAPLAMVVVNSIGPPGLAFFPPPRLSFEPYALITANWLQAAINSVLLAAVSSLIAAALGTLAALGLARAHPISSAFVGAILRSPLQVPWLVLGVAFLQFYGWLNVTSHLDLRGSFAGLTLAHSVVSLPFVFTVVLARMASFDTRLIEASYGLGAGPIRTFFRITLPIIMPAVLSGCIFAFLVSLDNVPLSLFLTGAGFSVLPVELFTAIQFDLQRTIYAVATLVCIGTTFLVLMAHRQLTSLLSVS